MLSREYDERIAEICNERQREYYQSYCSGNSFIQTAKQLNASRQNVSRSLRRLELAASQSNLIDNHSNSSGVAMGYKIKGTSTLYDADGKAKLQWVKTKENVVAVEEKMSEVCEYLAELTPIREKIERSPVEVIDNLMAVYPLGDPHLGLYAWAEETGENFDCEICEQLIVKAVDRLVDAMPAAKIGRIENLGDFFHSDDEDAVTRRSGNHLDVDGRWGRVLRIGVRMFTHCIDRCLEKHDMVEVVCEIGNHDDYTAYCLAIIIDHHYKNNPRVIVETAYSKFHYKEFGKVLIGTSHGTVKPDVLHKVMTSDMPEAWGRTKYRYWHVGHLHHSWVKEIAGVIIEGFRSLKGKDAYEAGAGYRAGRNMSAILFHKEFGEIERHTVSVDMITAGRK